MDELKKDDKVLTLQEKIIAIQSDLKTNVEKSQKAGKGSYLKYDYSRESDVLAVLKPLLAKYNIGYLVSHGQEYRLEQHDNMWVYGSMGVITIIDGDSDKSFSLGAPFIAQNNDPAKAVGSADTYAVKFALKKVFGLPDDELDPDNEQGQKPAAKPQEKVEPVFWDLVFSEIKNKTQKGADMMNLIKQWLGQQPATTENIKNACDKERRAELSKIMNGEN